MTTWPRGRRLPPAPLRRVHDALLQRLRRSRRLARALLGVQPTAGSTELWDYTTILLSRAVRPLVRPGQRVWDLGCGPDAVLARHVLSLAAVEVVASDIEDTCVERARGVVAGLDLPITVVQSDLGAAVPGQFDLVLFNAPYLPLGAPELLPTSRPRQGREADVYLRRFGGGPEGLDTISRFLGRVRDQLRPGGRVLLGFNRVYVAGPRVERLATDWRLRVTGRVRAWWNPSLVLVLEAAG